MSENNYYKDNLFKRGFRSLHEFFKKMPTKRFDAVAGAIGFFVILVAMLEYKVFQGMYGMTGDIVITASTLLVTAFGGVYSEVVLRRNEDATDDQNMYADWVFYISLGTSAFVGLGAWIQSMRLATIDLFFFELQVPEFTQISILIITLVTIADILILRAYFRADVNAVHRRNIARSNSRKKQADLQVEDKLIEFDSQVKSKTEQLLRVEARRKEVRTELQKLYGGRVPDDVMQSAMKELDNIMKEIKTGQDLDGDGSVGFNNATVYAQETTDFTQGKDSGK